MALEGGKDWNGNPYGRDKLFTQIVVDDNSSSERNAEVVVSAPILSISLGAEPAHGFVGIPIGLLERQQNGRIALREDQFIPSALAIGASDHFDYVIRTILAALDRIANTSESNGASPDALKTMSISEVRVLLNYFLGSRNYHPRVLFLELLKAIARLLILFPPPGKTPALPEYDHNSLYSCFSKLVSAFERIGTVEFSVLRQMKLAANVFAVQLTDNACSDNTELVIGVTSSGKSDTITADLSKLIAVGPIKQVSKSNSGRIEVAAYSGYIGDARSKDICQGYEAG